MKKRTCLIAALATFGLTLTGCDIDTLRPNSSQPAQVNTSVVDKDEDIKKIYKLYLDNGGTLSYEEWLATIKGEPGKDGTSIRHGQGAPAQTLGNDGDSYIDMETWDFYLKTGGSWIKSGNLKGAQGETGPQGDKGDKGDTGAPGENGKDGSDGKSAYEIYKEAHPEYEGNEQQWLDDLVNGRLGNQETFTVTFDLGYGQQTFTQKVKKGEKAKKPETPVRNGYSFVDWVDENRDHWVFNGYSITEDITIYAVWSDPIEYTVTFVNNGGAVLDVETGYYGETAVYHGATPVAENQDPHYIYTFTGWDKELVITANATITAQYATKYVATTAYYYDYDGQTLLATVPLAEGEAPHYDGETPTRERDTVNKLQFEFEKWEKTAETADTIKFVAKYASCTDGLEIKGNSVTVYHGTSADVTIPSSWGGKRITSIGKNAFSSTSVTAVSIPDSVISIGEGAFSSCASLLSITIPFGVTAIAQEVFRGCSALKSVVIPDSVTSTSLWSFADCTSLKSLVLPTSIKRIGDSSFKNCSSITTLSIPSSVTSIDGMAFYNCANLKTVTIPSSVASIGMYAFYRLNGCDIRCEEEYKPAGWHANWVDSGSTVLWGYVETFAKNGIEYSFFDVDDNQTAIVTNLSTEAGSNISIPSEVNGIKVVSINGDAWKGLSSTLKSIEFADGVEIKGDWSFEGFAKLKQVGFNNSLVSIPNYAFKGCASLTSIAIPASVISIGQQSFYGCNSLEQVTIPTFVATIGSNAFSNACVIYCEADSKPQGWDKAWAGNNSTVIWGAEMFTKNESSYTMNTFDWNAVDPINLTVNEGADPLYTLDLSADKKSLEVSYSCIPAQSYKNFSLDIPEALRTTNKLAFEVWNMGETDIQLRADVNGPELVGNTTAINTSAYFNGTSVYTDTEWGGSKFDIAAGAKGLVEINYVGTPVNLMFMVDSAIYQDMVESHEGCLVVKNLKLATIEAEEGLTLNFSGEPYTCVNEAGKSVITYESVDDNSYKNVFASIANVPAEANYFEMTVANKGEEKVQLNIDLGTNGEGGLTSRLVNNDCYDWYHVDWNRAQYNINAGESRTLAFFFDQTAGAVDAMMMYINSAWAETTSTHTNGNIEITGAAFSPSYSLDSNPLSWHNAPGAARVDILSPLGATLLYDNKTVNSGGYIKLSEEKDLSYLNDFSAGSYNFVYVFIDYDLTINVIVHQGVTKGYVGKYLYKYFTKNLNRMVKGYVAINTGDEVLWDKTISESMNNIIEKLIVQ